MKYFEKAGRGLIRTRHWPKKLTKKRALQLSIRKWEAIVEYEISHYLSGGDVTCALCSLYDGEDCEGCLIAEYTGNSNCQDTPYYDGDPKAELAFLKEVYLDKYGEEYP